MFEEFAIDGRAMAALERLMLGTGFAMFCQADFGAYFENLTYYATRLSKLKIDTRVVARAQEIYGSLCEPFIADIYPDGQGQTAAALEIFNSTSFVAVSNAFFDAQRNESAALLSVLDAELSSANVPGLLHQVLGIVTRTFGASLGVILLRDHNNELRVHASVGTEGLDLNDELSIPLGRGLTGRIAQSGEPEILPDLEFSDGLLNPMLRTRAGLRGKTKDGRSLRVAIPIDPALPAFTQKTDVLQVGTIALALVLLIGAGNSGAEIAMEVARRHPIWLSGRDTGHDGRRDVRRRRNAASWR